MGKKVLLLLVLALVLPSTAFSAPYGTSGTVTITGHGNDGLPESVLFSGTVTQFPSWDKTTLADGSKTYTFIGRAVGTMSDGTARNILIRIRVNKGENDIYSVPIPLPHSRSAISVPEPSSLALMGTGFVGLIGVIRRKQKQKVLLCPKTKKRPCRQPATGSLS